jgi:cyclic-di-GMP-binding protein
MWFRLPGRETSRQEGFPTRPRQLRRWLDALPVASMGDTTRQFFDGLKDLNGTSLPPVRRLELLELMRPMAAAILGHLGEHFINRTLPLPERSQRVAELNHAVLAELSAAYSRVVSELPAAGRRRDKDVALAAYRALCYRGEGILNSWRLYEAPPPGTWQGIYRLYQAAEARGVQEKPVTDGTLEGQRHGQVGQCFKRICLLALTRPLSLRQGETDRVADLLEAAADLAVISREPFPDSSNNVYLIDLESDDAPAVHKADKALSGPAIRCINLTPLIRDIRARIQAIGGTDDRDMNADLLRRMLAAWTRPTGRRFSRAPHDDEINVAIGLAGIYATIAEDSQAHLTPGQATSGIDRLTLQCISNDLQAHGGTEAAFMSETDAVGDAHAWDMVAKGNVITEGYKGNPPTTPIMVVGLGDGEPDHETWQLVNASPGGFCLGWRRQQTCRARVGELIALREKEGSQYQWRVGVIRWMLNRRDRGLEIGVRMLAPRTLLVLMEPSCLGHVVDDPIEALMMPSIKTIQQPPTLLAPPGRFRPGDEVLVTLAGRTTRVRLTGLGEHTSQFVQYTYTPLDRAEPGDDTDDSGFESVWSLI